MLRFAPQSQPWPLSTLSEMNECTLEDYELDSTDVSMLDVSDSRYIAMSYSWGEPTFDAPLIIQVNGERTVLAITESACEAVQRTLPAMNLGNKCMWIDEICISQHDTREQEQQVSLMGESYRRCWHCMIWLGFADAHTDAAFKLLWKLQKCYKHTKPMPLNERQIADLSHSQIRAELASKVGADVLPIASDPGWEAVARLLGREWLSRLWTFQEAALCYKGDASVRCGLHNIPFITLLRHQCY